MRKDSWSTAEVVRIWNRMNKERKSSKLMAWMPTDRRRQERPRTTWRQKIRKAMSIRSLQGGNWAKAWRLDIRWQFHCLQYQCIDRFLQKFKPHSIKRFKKNGSLLMSVTERSFLLIDRWQPHISIHAELKVWMGLKLPGLNRKMIFF